MPNRKILILGGSGFIGSALRARFDRQADAVDSLGSSELNLTGEFASEKLASRIDPEAILIVAIRARGAMNSWDAFQQEILMTSNIARGLRQVKPKKCIYLSTVSVYSDLSSDLAISEETAPKPNSLYGIAKHAGECLTRLVCAGADIPYVILRLCKVYGPRDNSKTYGPMQFIDSLLRQEAIGVYGDGLELRDHIFIDDAAEVISRMMFGPHVGTYAVATGESRSFTDMVACLRKISGQDFKVCSMPRTKPKVDQKIDIEKLKQACPDLKFRSLEQGLRETYDYYSKRQLQEAANRG